MLSTILHTPPAWQYSILYFILSLIFFFFFCFSLFHLRFDFLFYFNSLICISGWWWWRLFFWSLQRQQWQRLVALYNFIHSSFYLMCNIYHFVCVCWCWKLISRITILETMTLYTFFAHHKTSSPSYSIAFFFFFCVCVEWCHRHTLTPNNFDYRINEMLLLLLLLLLWRLQHYLSVWRRQHNCWWLFNRISKHIHNK